MHGDEYRWGLWAPFDFISSMAENANFSPTLALELISIIKYVVLRLKVSFEDQTYLSLRN